jgi:hypothetical protein
MRLPISSLTCYDNTVSNDIPLLSVASILSQRQQELWPNSLTGWRFFADRKPVVSLDDLIRFADAVADGRGQASLQLWLGDPPALTNELEFASYLASGTNDPMRLLEQWELTIQHKPFRTAELLLWAVSPPKDVWCQAHLSFCIRALKVELLTAVWNCFRCNELQAAQKEQNEYWGLRRFLARAIPGNALLTDARTPKQKSKLRPGVRFVPDAGAVIGRSSTGDDIIAVMDTPESLTAFEAALSRST